MVYAATHHSGQQRAAIKVLRPHLAADPELRARFQREGRAAQSLNHPGAVRILDDDVTEDGLAFLVMELLEGQTWKQAWLDHAKRLPVLDVLRTSLAVLDVLAAAHQAGVIHRDVKPENIFLTNSGEVKLLDFGIARAFESASERTQTGAMLGTPAYMSPEQALAKWSLVDSRSDLFSLGASMRSLLLGVSLHGATTGAEALVMAATRQAKPLLEICSNAPPALAALIDRAVAFDKEDRFASASEMRDAILQLERKDLPVLLEPAEAGFAAASGDATRASATAHKPMALEIANADAQKGKALTELSISGTLVSGSVARSVGPTRARRLGVAAAAVVVLGSVALGWFALRDAPSAPAEGTAKLASDLEPSTPVPSVEVPSAPAVVAPPSAAVPADTVAVPSAQGSQTGPLQVRSGSPVARSNLVSREKVQSNALIQIGKLRGRATQGCRLQQTVNMRVLIRPDGRWNSHWLEPSQQASRDGSGACVLGILNGGSSPPFSGPPIEVSVSVSP